MNALLIGKERSIKSGLNKNNLLYLTGTKNQRRKISKIKR